MFEDIVGENRKKMPNPPICIFCKNSNTRYIGITHSKNKLVMGKLVMGVACNRCKGEWFIPYDLKEDKEIIVDIFSDLGDGC